MTSSATTASHAEFLRSQGATLDDSGRLATYFGDARHELAAFSESAALIDRSGSTLLVQQGADALDLLHRLSTNDLLSLESGDSRFTILTSERGRIIDLLQVVAAEPGKLLLLSESTDPRPPIDWIEKFTIIEDSEVTDASNELTRLALIGPEALRFAGDAFGPDFSNGQAVLSGAEGQQIVLVSSRWGTTNRLDIVLPHDGLAATWRKLVEAGAVPAGDVAFHAARIHQGIPLAGRELTEKSNPLEVNLKDLVSFTKGCYVGQEVVARLDTYDKLQRRLVAFESNTPVEPGTELTSAGKRAGIVTSVSRIEQDGKTSALGVARRDYWTDGTELESPGGTVMVRQLREDSPIS